MRFIFGLICGTVLTFLVADQMDFDAKAQWQKLMASIQTATTETQAANKAPAAKPSVAPPLTVAHVDEQAREDEWSLPELEPQVAAQPAPADIAPIPSTPEPTTAAAEPENSAEPTKPLASAAPKPLMAQAPESEPSSLEVWIPFYSQASADGFATHLTDALDAKFNVEKRAAGRYVIVFDPANSASWSKIKAALVDMIGPEQDA